MKFQVEGRHAGGAFQKMSHAVSVWYITAAVSAALAGLFSEVDVGLRVLVEDNIYFSMHRDNICLNLSVKTLNPCVLCSNGTSMISLIIPPKDMIARVNKMLGDEYGTASNIKSRVNRSLSRGRKKSREEERYTCTYTRTYVDVMDGFIAAWLLDISGRQTHMTCISVREIPPRVHIRFDYIYELRLSAAVDGLGPIKEVRAGMGWQGRNVRTYPKWDCMKKGAVHLLHGSSACWCRGVGVRVPLIVAR